MVKRVKMDTPEDPELNKNKNPEKNSPPEKVGNYFTSDKTVGFVSSGCQILDSVMGHGFPLGKIVNIVGNKSAGKTLLAIELCNNFHKSYPEGSIYYHEAEAAFDQDYAQALGMPVEAVEFVTDSPTIPNTRIIEGLFQKLDEIIELQAKSKNKQPVLYILDSLDALSDAKEQESEIDAGTYGMAKAKQLSTLFRRLIQPLYKANILLLVISQVRDNVGAGLFGEKTTRSGGRALDFYASIILNLAEIEKIQKTVQNQKRPVGVWVRVKCKKNKISLPFRECDIPIHFGFGVEDIVANLQFLKSVKGSLEEIGLSSSLKDTEIDDLARAVRMDKMQGKENDLDKKISTHAKKVWHDIDNSFLPPYSKY